MSVWLFGFLTVLFKFISLWFSAISVSGVKRWCKLWDSNKTEVIKFLYLNFYLSSLTSTAIWSLQLLEYIKSWNKLNITYALYYIGAC